jgi:hypothetical protein
MKKYERSGSKAYCGGVRLMAFLYKSIGMLRDEISDKIIRICVNVLR